MLGDAKTLAPGGSAEATSRLFAGAKEAATVDAYQDDLGIKNFDLLIDWGWFYFITKPLFKLLDFFYRLFGNFGVSILIVTVLLKIVFFPLANKSYALHGQDEGGAAGDAGHPRPLRGRQGQAAAGADGALQEGEDQSGRRLLAGADPDPGLLRALQGAVRHHRDAARAVLRLDPRPRRARSDLDLQPVRPPALRPGACR